MRIHEKNAVYEFVLKENLIDSISNDVWIFFDFWIVDQRCELSKTMSDREEVQENCNIKLDIPLPTIINI